MECQTPYQLKERDKLTGDIITVPCGKCPACIGKYASGWSFRLLQQEKVSESAMFITLTYDEKHLYGEAMSEALLMTLKKEHLQNFMKRLRNAHEGNGRPPIKYYAVGEYGKERKRPHYHAIIFNALEKDIEKAWGMGYVHYGTVTGASIGYTLKYMCKKDSPVGISEGDDRQPEFALMSKGLGKNYLTEEKVRWHLSDPQNRMYVNIELGKKATLPRYYKDRIFSDQNFESMEQAEQVRKTAAYHSKTRMMNQRVKMMQLLGENAAVGKINVTVEEVWNEVEHNLNQQAFEAWEKMHRDVEEGGML